MVMRSNGTLKTSWNGLREVLLVQVLLLASVGLFAGCPAKGGGGTPQDAAVRDADVTLALYSVRPASGPLAGGTSVELSGVGFADGMTVRFGAVAATGVTVTDDGHASCTTPPGAAASPVTVAVELGNGASAQLVGGYEYKDEAKVDISWCNLQYPASTTTQVQVASELITGRVYAQGVTDQPGQGQGITSQLGYGPAGSDPTTDASWVWTDAVYNVDADEVNDEYMANLTVAQAGQYDYAYRVNGGGDWTYCDLNGSDDGYSTDQAGKLTVQDQSEPMVGWCILQWPATLDGQIGADTDPVFGRVFAEGVTEGPGQGDGVEAEAGYGPPGTNPQTDQGWTWVQADYNQDGPTANNDEYRTHFTPQAEGAFDYGYRFRRNGGPWTYCDLDGSDDGYSSSFAGNMTVTGDATGLVDWCQLQWPASTQTTVSSPTELIYGRVFAQGITAGAGQGAGVAAQVGYGPSDTDPSTDTNWQWFDAGYNTSVDGLTQGDLANDEYMGSVTVAQAGTYSYAYRFSKDGGNSWLYCDQDGSDNGFATDQAGALEVTTDATPQIASIVQPRGTVLGGSVVTINGTGFAAQPQVFFDGQAAQVQSSTAQSIVCTTPSHAVGLVDVKVSNGGGRDDTLTDGFEYILNASITVDGSLSDWDSLLQQVTNDQTTDATPGALHVLYVAFDDDRLYVGVQGTMDATESIVLYLDVDDGQSTGVSDMSTLLDNTGSLDDAISGTLTVSATGFGAEFAAGSIGGAQVDEALDDAAGWRGLANLADLAWLTGTVKVGQDALEFSVAKSVLWPTGVPAAGARVAIVVKLLKDAYGVAYSNQTLPQDSGGSTVSSVVLFMVYPAGQY